MTNPWMTSNPFMSLWLSGANQAAGAMRGAAAAELGRAQMDAARQAVAFWSDIWMTPITGPRPRKRRAARR